MASLPDCTFGCAVLTPPGGELHQHERVLDLRAGTLQREVEWESPAGCRVRVRSTRLVSLSQRSIAAIRYEVIPVDEELRVVVQSGLVESGLVACERGGVRARLRPLGWRPAGRRKSSKRAGTAGMWPATDGRSRTSPNG